VPDPAHLLEDRTHADAARATRWVRPDGISPSRPTASHPEAVGPNQFDPADLRCWLHRGRSIEQATELARIWRAHPDLPATAPLADRMEGGVNGLLQ
jgi:hypothetical protein